jgi:hypothetical protein
MCCSLAAVQCANRLNLLLAFVNRYAGLVVPRAAERALSLMLAFLGDVTILRDKASDCTDAARIRVPPADDVATTAARALSPLHQRTFAGSRAYCRFPKKNRRPRCY